MFVTLEDETGNVNVIVWQSVLEKYRREALNSALLAVYGTWQSEGGVRHLVAQLLVDMSHLLSDLTVASRDFH
jgi:error-prone DNA polymerase